MASKRLVIVESPTKATKIAGYLGRDYVVWDTRGEIEFITPGRGVLTARFAVSPDTVADIRERARGGAKVLEWFETDITDSSGAIVARVRREVYVREKRRVTDAGGLSPAN